MIKMKHMDSSFARIIIKIKNKIMRIDHLAIWVEDLEKMKDFYIKYFNASSNEKYVNATKGFSSYFLDFGLGKTRIELMHRDDINAFQHINATFLGFAHFALGLGSEEMVYEMTERLRSDGIKITGEPRITGDGYLESMILDPENNIVELTV